MPPRRRKVRRPSACGCWTGWSRIITRVEFVLLGGRLAAAPSPLVQRRQNKMLSLPRDGGDFAAIGAGEHDQITGRHQIRGVGKKTLFSGLGNRLGARLVVPEGK